MSHGSSVKIKNLRGSDEYAFLAKTIQEKSANREIHFCASPGNYGDALINVGTRQFFDDFEIEFEEFNRIDLIKMIEENHKDPIEKLLVVGGGGGWSRNFSSTKTFTELVASTYHQVVVLPTTFELPAADSQNILYFARDNKTSLETIPEATFCHDMAFYLDVEVPSPATNLWRLFAYRRDREGQQFQRYFANNIDLSLLGDGTYRDVTPFFSIINNFQQVFTDRLHVAIAASMLGKKVFITGGNYSKNRDVFTSSIELNFTESRFSSFDDVIHFMYPNRAVEESKRILEDYRTKQLNPNHPRQPGGTPESSAANTNIWRVLGTNSIILPIHSQLFREPPREYAEMTDKYLTRYDGHTLAADVFATDTHLFFIGPPLLNLEQMAKNQKLIVDNQDLGTAQDWQDKNRISFNRVETSTRSERVELEFGPEKFDVTPTAAHLDVFSNLNVVITLNRDNHLDNIRDWLVNMVRNHDVQAAIIYDNRSATYTKAELLSVMKSVPGLLNGFVIDWPHKYGNTGGPKQIWDSDFGQYMCWEHARWRFLQKANCVIISDVDEIPISSVGKTLVQHAEESKNGVFTYPVRDCPAIPRPSVEGERVRLHTDYLHSDLKKGTYSKKVVYQPTRLPNDTQVGNHQVVGVKATYSEEVISRHVGGVHLSWRNRDWGYSHTEREMDESRDFFDSELEEHYRKTFPQRFD